VVVVAAMVAPMPPRPTGGDPGLEELRQKNEQLMARANALASGAPVSPNPVWEAPSPDVTAPLDSHYDTGAPLAAGASSLPIELREGIARMVDDRFEREKLLQSNEQLYEEKAQLSQQLMGARRARIVLPVAVLGLAAAAQTRVATDASEGLSELLRGMTVDFPAESAMNRYFPGARSTAAVELATFEALSKRGFTKDNTLFASSVCPDEVNFAESEITERLKKRWGEMFALGGLSGLPFVGPAGFTAYAHHAPERGKLFILFGPHVGVDDGGKIGSLQRPNQRGVSKACGATIGSLKRVDAQYFAAKEGAAATASAGGGVVIKPASGMEEGDLVVDAAMMSPATNAQLQLLTNELAARMPPPTPADEKGLSSERVARATYEMYDIIREYFVEELIASSEGFWDDADELAVLGGIMINRAKGGDRFMPLLFQTRTKQLGSTQDLYPEAFGEARPSLTAALMSRERSDYMHRAVSLTRLKSTTALGNAEAPLPLDEAIRLDQAEGLRD